MFSVVIFSGIYIMGQFSISNPSYINDEKFIGFNKSFNQITELNTAVGELNQSIAGASPDWGVFGVINSLIKSVWSAFKQMVGTIGFIGTAIHGFGSIFGVPPEIVGLFVSLIVVIVVFSIYSLVFAGRT